MKVRYDKLWRRMKDNQLKKSELAKAANITSYSMAKLNHDRPVSMEVMMNLCKVFHCGIGNLMGSNRRRLTAGWKRYMQFNELQKQTNTNIQEKVNLIWESATHLVGLFMVSIILKIRVYRS